VALRPRLFCSLLGVVGRDTRRGVAERAPCRRTSFPRPSRSIRCGEPRHVAYCSESTVQFVCVMEYVAVVVQQSRASVLTCSDSKTRSQHGFLLCFFVSGHVPFTLPLRTLPFVLASVRRSTYFRTFFCCMCVMSVSRQFRACTSPTAMGRI